MAPGRVALLASVGFRPTRLAPDRAWRLAAIVSLAMADAAEEIAGLPDGTIRLKWPNDLVIETGGPRASLVGEVDASAAAARLGGPLEVRKVGGVLGETDGLGTPDPRAVVGIGVNADWPAVAFPPELASSMTSLREASGGRPIDRDSLLEGFLDRLQVRHAALRAGTFDVGGWVARQATTGRAVRIETADGPESVLAVGVDGASGALIVAEPDGRERPVHSGEVVHVRLVAPVGV